ncbi:2OG-Fe(II) oxygenase [Pseudorhodoferax aquiterrae]|uniref:2-oxoglutarate-dependent ethylene/succinate-forming enzyme n=1 Tax=Pseudorhodoferax aquiterrae TaxID=747304 RepID=A0ABQ3G4F5_9BURK|nr:isopenicillin N synthase family oxygenase [Pseudorhodoferax aquiterrae]GHC89385.1 2OG-Fe(II) oxygenase [Pseudorhodoferax aquiterrae]
MTTSAIPVIDLAAALHGRADERLRAARAMEAACTDIGFFTIRGHGVPLQTIDALRGHAKHFFNLPLATKLDAAPQDPRVPRGYRALGFDALSRGNAGDAPGDLKEYYHFGREHWPDEPYFTGEEGRGYFIPNRWPAAQPGFAEAAAAYYAQMERLTGEMMSLVALALGIPEDFFDDKIDRHITAMRINFYPEQKVAPEPGQLRAGAHTDYGLLTILNGENTAGGLQVCTRQGEWLPVETAPDTFVVNIGDLLMRWTNDRWVSNVHRVVNPPAEAGPAAQRISIAFFHHPNYDALVECVAPPGEAKYPPVRSGDYRTEKYRQTRV